MQDIDSIMKMLDWNNDPDVQALGISQARQVKCIKAFFQPTTSEYSKSVWENCAIVISSHTDSELALYLPDMLVWMQDLNWPGAEIIFQRLVQYSDKTDLYSLVSRLIPALAAIGDDVWLDNIRNLIKEAKLETEI